MSKPTDSFFDSGEAQFSLWRRPTGMATIMQSDIVFQSPLFKVSRKSKAFRERYFVLTRDSLYYLKSEAEPKILGVMATAWVRVDYIAAPGERSGESNFCLRFARNMRYTDLWTTDEVHFRDWRAHLSRVFVQVDFHTKFTTLKMIGKGSFARVYLIENRETRAQFAVKAFSKEHLLSQPKGRESLLNEIEIMRRIQHPYLLCLEEVHESQNSVYLVLELLEGGELLTHLDSKETLSYRDCWRVMKCILEALAHMADRGIMHRDLKPENIILKEKNKLETCTLKLVDFGLATRWDAPEYIFKRCGTPGYVAPEVINAPSNENVHYSPKCDVFSAGVILYLMLAERTPFEGRSFHEVLQRNKACRIDFKNPRLRRNKAALDLLMRMLDSDPDRRVSAREALSHRFFTDLEDGEAVVERDPGSGLRALAENHRLAIEKGRSAEANSLVVRDNVINGKTVPICDSPNSKGVIASFKSMSSPKKSEISAKRESILKLVLTQSSSFSSSSETYNAKFIYENFESDVE